MNIAIAIHRLRLLKEFTEFNSGVYITKTSIMALQIQLVLK
jgi:hypothetical protein